MKWTTIQLGVWVKTNMEETKMKLGKLILGIVIVSLIVSMAIPMATAKKPPKPPPGGEDPPADPAIAFRGSKGPRNTIVVMNADGSNQATVFSADSIGHLTCSPNLNAVAAMVMVRRGNDYSYDLWRIDISIVDGVPQGSEPIELTQDITYGPAWSPQGDVIAFTENLPNNDRILTVPADGGSVQTIYTAPEGYNVASPAWNSDASKMAFVQGSNGHHSIMLLDLSDGSTTTVYGPISDPMGFVDWARTKDELAIYGVGEIYLLDLTQPSPTPEVLLEDGAPRSPSWSPDDSQLVFETTVKRGRVVSVYTFSTEEIDYLANGMHPDWCRE
jgi:dipeptidyl aminopeptidase/acylaminoacyl peptidase